MPATVEPPLARTQHRPGRHGGAAGASHTNPYSGTGSKPPDPGPGRGRERGPLLPGGQLHGRQIVGGLRRLLRPVVPERPQVVGGQVPVPLHLTLQRPLTLELSLPATGRAVPRRPAPAGRREHLDTPGTDSHSYSSLVGPPEPSEPRRPGKLSRAVSRARRTGAPPWAHPPAGRTMEATRAGGSLIRRS